VRTSTIALGAALAAAMTSPALGTERISIGTGGTGGTGGLFYVIGAGIAEILNDHMEDATARAEVTGASVENIRRVAAVQRTFGFSSSSTLYETKNGEGPFEAALPVAAMAYQYPAVVQVGDGGGQRHRGPRVPLDRYRPARKQRRGAGSAGAISASNARCWCRRAATAPTTAPCSTLLPHRKTVTMVTCPTMAPSSICCRSRTEGGPDSGPPCRQPGAALLAGDALSRHQQRRTSRGHTWPKRPRW
jgi:hypothetical protein